MSGETTVSDQTNSIPIGVCVLPKPPINRAQPVNYPDYIHEILNHAGLCYARIEFAQLLSQLPTLKLLVTVGEAAFDAALQPALSEWVKAGGAWVSIGGVCEMGQLLGVAHAPPAYANWGAGACVLGEGYLVAKEGKHPAIAHLQRPLHFFGGIAMKAAGASIIAGSTDAHRANLMHDVLFENRFGAGRAITCAVDITGTIVRMQQGIAVTRDGVSAGDGTAPVADGVLKSGDGCTLDWIFDRQPLPGAFGLQCFLEPLADLWREVILRSIFHLASVLRFPLALLWLYPRKLRAIAHMSHDSDGNEPDKARTLLSLLRQAEINSTWCIILPGYDEQLMSEIKQAGHEFATHYDAMTMTQGFTWGEVEFDQQWQKLKAMFGQTPVTNKNHYLRWQGDTEFFDWCQKRGIELDQSKGPSKTGEAGFNFGSCHPYLPVTFEGRVIDVLELPTLTQDLCVFAPPALLDALIAGVVRVHGVLHLLFHPAHVAREDVCGAIVQAVARAKAEGMEWWTARQINSWERARRQVSWVGFDHATNRISATLRAQSELADATILALVPGETSATSGDHFTAWGFSFLAQTRTIRAEAVTFDCP
jgi:hypothetical protein